jgi:hypothetical protein
MKKYFKEQDDPSKLKIKGIGGGERKVEGFVFTDDQHEAIFLGMCDKGNYIRFSKFLPFLMLFFVVHMNTALN